MISDLVTIGMPVVNARFFQSALLSALNQSYTNIEIIVINNANNQKEKFAIKQIVDARIDKRIIYIENEQQLDKVNNWNKCVQYGKGHFFSILCEDDMWDTNFITEMFKLAIKYRDINIFHSRVIIIDECENQIKYTPLCNELEDGLDFIYHSLAGYRTMFLSGFFVRLPMLNSINGFVNLPDGWGSDDLTWFRLARNSGIAYSFKPLTLCRNYKLMVNNAKNTTLKLKALTFQFNLLIGLVDSKSGMESLDDQLKINMAKRELKSYIGQGKTKLVSMFVSDSMHLPKPIAYVISKCYVFLHYHYTGNNITLPFQ